MQETWEKKVWSLATHSSIPAWRIPWSEQLGGLQSMGLQRIRLDWVNITFTFTWRKVDSSSFPFFFFLNWIIGILLYKVVSGILDNKTLSHIWLKNGFSHSVGCLFTLWIVSFNEQNILIFMESNWSVLSCVASAFRARHQDMTCLPTHSALFLPLLFLRPSHSPLETLASPCPSSTQGPLPP